jgi:hypothetical protein
MPTVSTIIAIDDIYPGPQPELPRNLVVCFGHYFVVTRPGHLRPIDAREFERRRRHAPIVSEYFDFGILNEHWRKDDGS